MAMTLLEALKLAEEPKEAFVINEFISSELLSIVPFKNIEGSGYHYNKVGKLPNIGFRGYNEGYSEGTGVINPQSEALKLFGGDMDVDKAIIDMEGPEARASHLQLKIEAARLRFEKTFIKGNSATEPREFDGLQNRITGNQLIANGADNTGNVLSLNSLDEMLDRVKGPANAKAILCNLAVKRRITAAARNTSVGGHVNFTVDELGREVMQYRGIRLVTLEDDNEGNEILSFTEASPDGTSTTNNTSIYCVRFGDMQTTGLQGRSNGTFGISVNDLGEIDSKPVFRTRVDWNIAIAVLNGRSAARLHGVQDGAAVA